MKNSVFIVDIFETLVANVATRLNIDVYYQYGSIQEIIDNLKTMTMNGLGFDNKYPLVALLTDFKQTKGKTTDIYSEANLNVLIFNVTDNKYLAPERTLYSFKTILYPIYEYLIDEIKISKLFKTPQNGEVEHNHTDHYYWGRVNEKDNPFSDWIDAIELENLNIKVKTKYC